MKRFKKIFKPVIVVCVFVAIGVTLLCKKGILTFKIKSLYKHICKMNESIQKMYAKVFNPYRIPNGIRPGVVAFHEDSVPDVATCHNLIKQRKQSSVV